MNQSFKTFLLIIVGALILLASAYINKYPIVYSDTATYIGSGFNLEAPFDRPITYGLFLRFTSLNGLSLWLVIFAQALIVSFLIFKLFKICLPKTVKLQAFFLMSISFLALFTSLSWTTSQLISDIFTSTLLLSFSILLIDKQPKWTRILIYSIFLLSTTMHLSHITFNVLLITTVLIIRATNVFGIKKAINLQPLLICLFLTAISVSTMGSAISKSKHIFLMGALVEHGIAKAYLDDNCADNNYKLCEYKDVLPQKAWEFVWEEDSPLYKIGGWKETKEEFSEIIYNTLTTPKYITLHIKESFKATLSQLSKFEIGEGNGVFTEETPLFNRIKKHYNHELAAYTSSLQNKKNLGFLSWYNTILLVVIYISIFALLIALINFKKIDKKMLALIVILLLAILINAWTCGTLANAINRLGCKVIWLIPLISIIGGMNSYKKPELVNSTLTNK